MPTERSALLKRRCDERTAALVRNLGHAPFPQRCSICRCYKKKNAIELCSFNVQLSCRSFAAQLIQIESSKSGRGEGGKVKANAKSRSSRSGLQFSVDRIHRLLRKGNYVMLSELVRVLPSI